MFCVANHMFVVLGKEDREGEGRRRREYRVENKYDFRCNSKRSSLFCFVKHVPGRCSIA